MGFRAVAFSKNRELIYDMLTRARRFHCSVNAGYDFDVTDTLRRLKEARRAGRKVGLTALLVRATSELLARYPHMNHHLFHGLLGKRVVEFDHISCTLIVARRGPDGAEILLPIVLRGSDRMTLEEIDAQIRRHRTADLASLPQARALARLMRLPRFVLRLVSYLTRSSPRFYERYFGTYGLSSLVTMGWGARSAATLANVCSTFLPGTIQSRAVVRKGRVEPRRILSLLGVFDHFLVDGRDITRAMNALRPLLESPLL